MRKFKGLLLLVTFILIMSLAAGCAPKPADAPTTAEPANNEKIVLKAASAVTLSHPYNQGLIEFGRLLEEKTNGKYSLEVFHSAQLGSERETVEGLQMGTIDIAVVSTAPLVGFTDAFLVTDLPFIFNDKQHAYKVLDGEIGKDMFKELESKNLKGLAFWESGFRHVTNSKKPILVPSDMKGIKIRTMENQIHIDSFKQLGADPTPMAFGELYTALQQKTVDAEESPLATIETSKFYEVQKYITLTGHFYPPAPLLASKALWDKLTDEEKTAFQEAANESRDYERKLIQDMEDKLIPELEQKGMKFVETDKSLWQEAMAPVYAKYEDKIGKELIQKIKDLGK